MSYISTGSGNWFIITVGNGYGSFFFRGTEEEAEKMRKHKARWEQAVATKRFATQAEIATGTIAKDINEFVEVKLGVQVPDRDRDGRT